MTNQSIKLFNQGTWLVCEPLFFDVTYEINPWMSVARRPEKTRAQLQWTTLHHTLLRLGAWLEYVQPEPELPDLVFTANGGMVKGPLCVIPKFMHKERQGEEEKFKAWFENAGFAVAQTKFPYEGEGDTLFAGDVLFGGFGFRTDRRALDEVGALLGVTTLVACELQDPYFYHLDTCFCPLDAQRALYVRSAFTADTIKEMGKYVELIEVPEEDAKRFACNSVVLDKSIVLPSGCEKTEAILKGLGITPYSVQLDEFLKAGGSAKCLSLRLDR
jgi:N-dimethylarginine dimethylaminohydrolase